MSAAELTKTDSKSDIPEWKQNITRVIRMLRFLGIEEYELDRFGLDWPPDIAVYGDNIRVFFGVRSQMALIRVDSDSEEESYYIKEPNHFIMDRCYFPLIRDCFTRIDSLSMKWNNNLFLEELLLRAYGLEFLEAFNFIYAYQS